MEKELLQLRNMGVKLHLLLNANCYGREALSGKFAETLEAMLSFLTEKFNLSGVTTTSLFVARLCKKKLPALEVRSSVNMNITARQAMEYVADYFDGFYAARSLNRDPEALKQLRIPGKKLYLLANSGCLSNCPAHTFHDNLVAHEAEIDHEKSCWNFQGICWERFSQKSNQDNILADSTWIRPEEIDLYEGIVDGIKVASRTNPHFGTIIKAYAERSFTGNILSLCEPDFSKLIYLENSAFPANWMGNAKNSGTSEYNSLIGTVKK
jgi:collagenase-like PrtC family protease